MPNNGDHKLAAPDSAGFERLPAWLVGIRQAVCKAIKAEDLEAIFTKQVELAKQGDRSAAKFVLEQARNFSEIRGLKLVQHIHYGDGPPPRRTAAAPGSGDKIGAMRARAAAGRPTCSEEDGPCDENPDLT